MTKVLVINKTGYRGVRYNAADRRFEAWIRIVRSDGCRVRLYCGGSTDPREAALIYDRWAREHHGERAICNFGSSL